MPLPPHRPTAPLPHRLHLPPRHVSPLCITLYRPLSIAHSVSPKGDEKDLRLEAESEAVKMEWLKDITGLVEKLQEMKVSCGPLWPVVASCGPLWPVVVSCGQLWSVVVRCGQLWSGLQAWPGRGEMR